MINILIVEDDVIQRQILRKVLCSVNTQFNIYEASDKNEALEIVKEKTIDLFFVDIFLKNSSGLEFALELRKISKYVFSFIIFLTTHVEYITQAFKSVHCYDYILKPYDKDEIIDMVKKISGHAIQEKSAKTERKFVLFKLKSEIDLKVYVDQINFIEIQGRDCIVNTLKESYTIKKLSLKKALDLIDSTYIIQSHKSFLVNVKNISKIERIDGRSGKIYFNNCESMAFLGYKFKDLILENFHTTNL